MSGCKECGTPLKPGNKSGLCHPHVLATKWRDPEFRAKHKAAMSSKAAHDPEFREGLRARAKAISANPEAVAKRTRYFIENKLWEKGAASITPEHRKRSGKTCSDNRLAWCPPHLRKDYMKLVESKRIPAAEARQMIEEQNELDMARWRRSIGVEVEPTKFEPAEPDLTPLESAIELVAHRCRITIGKLFSEERFKIYMRPRFALATAMQRQGYSQREIAEAMHRSDHTTALHWIRRGEALVKTDRAFAALVDELVACWHRVELAA